MTGEICVAMTGGVGDMHPKKVTVKKVTGVKLVTLFILILAVTQHIH
jgi:hypothetical protein